jgi:hypothetical protein
MPELKEMDFQRRSAVQSTVKVSAKIAKLWHGSQT